MSAEQRPAADSIGFLEQGIRLIRRLDDASFTRTPAGPFRGGVGSQFRHCLDLYRCFLRGLESGRVDYGARERDSAVERDRGRAESAAREIIRSLQELDDSRTEQELRVSAESVAGGLRPGWSSSSVGRELQFLVSHTVHHYALISAMLTQQGFRFEGEFAGFGVAPSTLLHWKEGDSLPIA